MVFKLEDPRLGNGDHPRIQSGSCRSVPKLVAPFPEQNNLIDVASETLDFVKGFQEPIRSHSVIGPLLR